MIYAFSLLLIGSLIGQFYPIEVRSFVWGAFDKARGFTGNAFSPRAPNNPIPGKPSASLAELAERAWSVIDALWRWKYVILAVFLFVVIGGMLRGCNVPFLGQSADDVRREIAESEAEHAQAERDVAIFAGERGDETQRRERVIEMVVAQGKQDIEDAASTQDFDRLWMAYDIGYRGVLDDAGSDARDEHSRPRGSPMVRQSPSNRA